MIALHVYDSIELIVESVPAISCAASSYHPSLDCSNPNKIRGSSVGECLRFGGRKTHNAGITQALVAHG
jgi:hypothetical protein